MTIPDKFGQGRRNGIKWAVQWLHDEAKRMNDPHAEQVLNAAAFHMGNAAKRKSIESMWDEGAFQQAMHDIEACRGVQREPTQTFREAIRSYYAAIELDDPAT